MRKNPSPRFSRSIIAARTKPKTMASALPSASTTRLLSAVVQAGLLNRRWYWPNQSGSMV